MTTDRTVGNLAIIMESLKYRNADKSHHETGKDCITYITGKNKHTDKHTLIFFRIRTNLFFFYCLWFELLI
jgi:hypothetical protein